MLARHESGASEPPRIAAARPRCRCRLNSFAFEDELNRLTGRPDDEINEAGLGELLVLVSILGVSNIPTQLWPGAFYQALDADL